MDRPESIMKNPDAPAESKRPVSRIWAPLLAFILALAFYGLRLDSVFYFLLGSESQGMLLGQALADGLGFIDLSLPGHPAHVREPPLFYLGLAALIKLFGMKLYPMKVMMWLCYGASAAAAAALGQRASGALAGLAAAVALISCPDLFRFFTGPKSDVPFMFLVLSSMICLVSLSGSIWPAPGKNIAGEREGEAGRKGIPAKRRLYILGFASAALVLASVFTRSMGLALVVAWTAHMLFPRLFASGRGHLWRRSAWAAAIAVPVLLALLLWGSRGDSSPGSSEFGYVDWFMMDLKPDSPEMIAVDFHAPLMGPVPRASIPKAVKRVVTNGFLYQRLALLMPMVPAGDIDKISGLWAWSINASALGLALLGLAGLWRRDRTLAEMIFFFMASYFGAMSLWPMLDPRLVFPLLPFSILLIIEGARLFLEFLAARVWRAFKVDPDKGPGKLFPLALLLASVISVTAFNLVDDVRYYMAASRLPTETFRPGFKVRFSSRDVMDSYKLLMIAAEVTEPDSILIYHSPPPCRLFTGRTCGSIPYSHDLKEVRDYLAEAKADYVLADEWGSSFPGGPGWFVENVLVPTIRAYPESFEVVAQVPGTGSAILKIKKESSP